METLAPKKLNIPYFLLHYLIESSIKVQAGNSEKLAHHGLIKILVEEALHTFTLPIAWEIFRNMTTKDYIKALTYDIIPTGSEEEEHQGGEGETTGDLVEQKGKEEETKIEEEKVAETEQEETKQIETEWETEGGEKGAEKTEVPRETLEREATAGITTLSTPIKPKEREKGRPPCISRPGKAQEFKPAE